MRTVEAYVPLFLLLAACDPDATSKDSDSATGSTSPTIEATTIETVFLITWDSAESVVGEVQYGLGEEWNHTSAAVDSEDGHHHEATVAFPGGQMWAWRVVDNGVPGEGGTVDVPPPPSDLPGWTLSKGGGSPDGGYTVGTMLRAGDGTAIWVLDSEARYVWWWLLGGTEELATAVTLSKDGQWIEWLQGDVDNSLHRIRIDGSETQEIPVAGIHHDFLELPEGGWAAIARRPGEQDGVATIGEAIVEIAEDGTETEIFNTWDAIDVVPDEGLDTDDGKDAVHGNGLFFDEPNDRYYLSSWARSSVMAINRSDGSLIYEIGGPHSQYELTSGTGWEGQHAPRIDTDGNLMVFDNGSTEAAASRVASFIVDEGAGQYAQEWEYKPDPAIYCGALGDADRQDDGSLFIAWGLAGRIEHLDASYNLVWQADADLGGALGYAHHAPIFAGSPG